MYASAPDHHSPRKTEMKTILLLCAILCVALPASADSYDDALKLFQQNKYDDALKTITDTLDAKRDREPGSPNYRLRFLAAHAHWKKGNLKGALSHFRKCAEIDRATPDPYIDAALMLVEHRKLKEADSFLRKGRKIKDDPMFYYIWGRMALANRNAWRAKELLEKSISMDPALYASYHALGMALMRLKRYSEANTAFATAHELMPSSGIILNNLALSYELLGKNAEAVEAYRKAQKLAPENTAIFDNLSRAEKLTKK